MSAVRDFFRPSRVSVGGMTIRDVINAPYVRLATLTAIAGTLAYFLGARIPNVSATTASITAMVSMRHTFHESIRESFTQVLGVLAGATVAFIAMQLIGFNSIVVMLSIFTCFIVSRLMKLGEEGAVAIAITVILVVGPSMQAEKIETRFYGVLLGVVIAMAMSYFVRAGQPQDRALKAGIKEARALARLLHDISVTLAKPGEHVTSRQAGTWLATAEFISHEVEVAREQALSAVAGARWSPLLDRREALVVLRQIEMTAATSETVVNICRELVLAFDKTDQLPALLVSATAAILDATANVIFEQADVAEDDPAMQTPDDEWLETKERAMKDLRNIDDTQPLFIGGSILRDAEKIKDILGD